MTLIAEDLLLLLIDDVSGRLRLDRTRLDRVLAGAVLIELALAERISPAMPGEPARAGTLVVRAAGPTGDVVLDAALSRLGSATPTKPARAVEKLVKGIRETLLHRVVAAGFVHEQHGTTLGVFPTTRWPAIDVRHESALRAELSAVLIHGQVPQRRVAALISLLVAVDAVPKVVPTSDKRALVRRAKQVADGDWAGEAVRKAVDAVNAAVIAAMVATSSAT